MSGPGGPAAIAIALAAINAAAFGAFGIDKARAKRREWRLPERTLLLLALMGGVPGAYAGRAAFRHKTRKQAFSSRLHAIAILQAVTLGALAAWAAVA